MAFTGTITIGGTTYTWSSPTLQDLAHLEARLKRSLIGGDEIVNTVSGRIELACLCLREHHPDLTPGILGATLHAEDLPVLWTMIREAIPLWGSPIPPSSSSPSDSDGPPPSSEPSE